MEAEEEGWTWGAAFWRFMADATEESAAALAAIDVRFKTTSVSDDPADSPFYATA